MISLTQEPGSFPFQEKHIVLTGATKITLGLEDLASSAIPRERISEPSNGWFGAKHSPDSEIVPLPLSELHAEIWLQGNQVSLLTVPSHLQDILYTLLSAPHLITDLLAVRETQVFIRDLDSAFGTFVNDVRIQQSTVLLDGDIIVRRPYFAQRNLDANVFSTEPRQTRTSKQRYSQLHHRRPSKTHHRQDPLCLVIMNAPSFFPLRNKQPHPISTD